jgi:hypothetical protein
MISYSSIDLITFPKQPSIRIAISLAPFRKMILSEMFPSSIQVHKSNKWLIIKKNNLRLAFPFGKIPSLKACSAILN